MLLYNTCIGRSVMKPWYFLFSIVEEVWRCAGHSCQFFLFIKTPSLPFKEKWFCVFPHTPSTSAVLDNGKTSPCFSQLHSEGRRWSFFYFFYFFPSNCLQLRKAPALGKQHLVLTADSARQVNLIFISNKAWFIGEVTFLIQMKNTELQKEAS